MTVAVDIAAAILLIIALWRRPQAICVTLAVGYLLALPFAQMVHGDALRPLAIALDAGVVAVMVPLWYQFRSDRARLVGTIGFLKVVLGLTAAAGSMQWGVYAAVNNGLFFLQILIAGGMADGIMAWLGYRLRGVCRGAARARAFVEHR